jgi:hypothetical protein
MVRPAAGAVRMFWSHESDTYAHLALPQIERRRAAVLLERHPLVDAIDLAPRFISKIARVGRARLRYRSSERGEGGAVYLEFINDLAGAGDET